MFQFFYFTALQRLLAQVISCSILKKEPSKMSIKKKRFEAALNDTFRENVVFLA